MGATVPALSADCILIADYDPAWPRLFKDERQRLQAAIGEWPIAIEHIGSTAVPDQVKRRLVQEHSDKNEYAVAKSDFVQDILARARGSQGGA